MVPSSKDFLDKSPEKTTKSTIEPTPPSRVVDSRLTDSGVNDFFLFFYFILEKPATRPHDRCGKEQLVYPFVTGFPGSSRVSALAPYSSGDRVGSTLSTPHAGGDLGLFRW
jgi:hypothetical protein